MQKRIDRTIENICDWIDRSLDQTSSYEESQTVPNMVSALAELVMARNEVID